MGFFSRVRKALPVIKRIEDVEKEKLQLQCSALQSLGVDARVASRGQLEEGLEKRLEGASVGVIDIAEGPIRWINVRGVTHQVGGEGAYTSGGPTNYWTHYGVPDTRLGPNSPSVKIKTVRIRNFPLIGKVVDLRWKGKGFGLRIVNRLNNDLQLKSPIVSVMKSRARASVWGSLIALILSCIGGETMSISSRDDVTIRAQPDHRCWIISTNWLSSISEELWNCYQAIAQHLLIEQPPTR